MFRKKLTEIAVPVALALFAGAAQAATVDIAVNGGFETGDFSGWTQFPNGGTQSISSPGSNASGPASTSAGNLFVPVNTGGGAIDNLLKNANLQAGFLTPGAPITVSFDLRGTLSGAGGVVFVELFSELSGGGTSASEILYGPPLFPTAGWTNYSFTTNLGPDVSGGVTVQLKASCGPVVGCGVDAYFDNLTVTTDVSAIPVPAAVWLFGSGLVGLVGVARRKKKSA